MCHPLYWLFNSGIHVLPTTHFLVIPELLILRDHNFVKDCMSLGPYNPWSLICSWPSICQPKMPLLTLMSSPGFGLVGFLWSLSSCNVFWRPPDKHASSQTLPQWQAPILPKAVPEWLTGWCKSRGFASAGREECILYILPHWRQSSQKFSLCFGCNEKHPLNGVFP